MLGLIFAVIFAVGVAIYLVWRNRLHWSQMAWWHKSLVMLASINALIMVVALIAAWSQRS